MPGEKDRTANISGQLDDELDDEVTDSKFRQLGLPVPKR
jgi:hypothetical protein